MTLRIATPDDNKRIHDLLKVLLEESKYNGFFRLEELENAIPFYNNPDTQKERITLLVEEEGRDIGLAIFEVLPAVYDTFLIARMVAIYIDPAFRGKGHMDEVHKVFEYWGKRAGAKYYNIGVSRENVDLSNRGYEKYEVMYMKEVE